MSVFSAQAGIAVHGTVTGGVALIGSNEHMNQGLNERPAED